MHLAIVGLNHKTASVEVRERVAFTEASIERALSTLIVQDCVEESLILSTCNRTEVYCVFKTGCFDTQLLRRFVADSNGLCCEEIDPYLYELSNREAVQHLFRVVSGLDSMVVGENQIAAQAKQAYRIATTVKATGPILNKLFHVAFRVGKKVRSQTGIGTGSLSISQVACDLAEKIFRRLSERSVLLIGAGENGELTAKILKGRGVQRLFITNRTLATAHQLAQKIGAEAVPFEDLARILADVDIIISSTGAPEAILGPEQITPVLSRRQLPLFVIDLAVPRDIDPAVDRLNNVFLYDLDALQGVVEKSLDHRSGAAHQAKQIVTAEVDRFVTWHTGQKATPTIVEMQARFDAIRQAELDKIRDKMTDEQYELVEAATRAMMNKVLHTPILSIRDAASHGDQRRLIKAIRTVLGLGEES